MWVLKLEKTAENTLIAALAQKHGVSFSGYPISHILSGKFVTVRVAGFVEGTQDDIDRFVKEIKKEKWIENISHHQNFVLALIKLPADMAILYDPEVIFVQPAMYGKDGKEVLELASWDKEPLMKIADSFKKIFNCKILTFTQKKINSIGLVNIHPELTEKQKHALQLAVQHGYYSYPRKITLEKLAQIMGVSFSTYQAHLAKAESHFVPEMAGKFL